MGRPKIGERVSCFLDEKTIAWLDETYPHLGMSSRAQLIRYLVEYCHNDISHIEAVLKLKRKVWSIEQFNEFVASC